MVQTQNITLVWLQCEAKRSVTENTEGQDPGQMEKEAADEIKTTSHKHARMFGQRLILT